QGQSGRAGRTPLRPAGVGGARGRARSPEQALRRREAGMDRPRDGGAQAGAPLEFVTTQSGGTKSGPREVPSARSFPVRGNAPSPRAPGHGTTGPVGVGPNHQGTEPRRMSSTRTMISSVTTPLGL